MVRVTVAGGTGQVSQEVIDALLASKKHHITILSRREAPTTTPPAPEIQWQIVDYNDKRCLTEALRGTHTLLSFVQILSDPDQTAQKNLIDAAIAAGVKRVFDFENRRAIVVDGHEDSIMTLTSVADVAAVVARAVDYEGRWPTTGGIRGNRVTFSQILEIGRRVRGWSFTVDKVKVEDLEAGNLKTSWGLEAVHRAVSEDQASALLKAVSIGVLLSSLKGAWDISDELNQLFPDYEFTRIEDFLAKTWEGKP
ncbi:hypothetical protein DL767_005972 [Monosporascus sp. MG133]|nr:hypothetical protein DL767_005972 [Monosporascus sp. MG133]